jgi:aspartate racemase
VAAHRGSGQDRGDGTYLQQVLSRIKDDGCDAVALCCTEIPLIINDTDAPLPTLDSTSLLTRAALRRARD